MNKEYLRKKCYKMGNSQFPIDVFYNDIRDNPNPNFDKELAYKDLEKVVNYIEDLRKENQELRKSIKSWDETAGNLLKENTKLKEALKFLCEELEIKLCSNGYLSFEDKEYYLDYQSDIDLRTLHRITKEKYNLLEEVLSNER